MITDVEFYADTNGTVFVLYPDGSTKMLAETDRVLIEGVLDTLESLHPECLSRLKDIYRKSSNNKVYHEYRIVQRFIRCNWPLLDSNTKDFSPGQINSESFYCSLRQECEQCGIICNPKISTTLTSREIEVFSLIASGMQSEEIADKLFLSVHTINRHRENIKLKIEARSVAEMIIWWNKHQPL